MKTRKLHGGMLRKAMNPVLKIATDVAESMAQDYLKNKARKVAMKLAEKNSSGKKSKIDIRLILTGNKKPSTPDLRGLYDKEKLPEPTLVDIEMQKAKTQRPAILHKESVIQTQLRKANLPEPDMLHVSNSKQSQSKKVSKTKVVLERKTKKKQVAPLRKIRKVKTIKVAQLRKPKKTVEPEGKEPSSKKPSQTQTKEPVIYKLMRSAKPVAKTRSQSRSKSK